MALQQQNWNSKYTITSGLAAFISTKDVLFLLFILPFIAIVAIAASHTFSVLVYFGTWTITQLLLPLIACVLAVSLIVQKHAIHSLLSLMGVFISTAGIYFTIGAGYFALVFLLIGQGAVAILFLYSVILLPLRALQGNESRFEHSTQSVAVGSGIPGFLFFLLLLNQSFTSSFTQNETLFARDSENNVEGLRYFVNVQANDILTFIPLYQQASALFMLITAILLTALLGAIVIATSTGEDNK